MLNDDVALYGNKLSLGKVTGSQVKVRKYNYKWSSYQIIKLAKSHLKMSYQLNKIEFHLQTTIIT